MLPTLVGLNATSYLNHVDPEVLAQSPLSLSALKTSMPSDPDQGIVAGVLIAGDIHVGARVDSNNCGYDLEPCDVSFLYDMQFSVDANGYFAVIPHRIRLDATNGSLCNGFGIPGDIFGLEALKPTVQDLFETQFPNEVHDAAKAQQRIPTPDHSPLCKDDGTACGSNFDCCSRACDTSGVCAASSSLPWSCVYNINEAGADSADYDAAQSCSGARFELKQAALQGALNLGITPQQESGLNGIIDDTNNWRCRRPSADEVVDECSRGKQIRGKCEFKIPAETIVPEPDEVRLGFSELDNFVTAAVPNPSDSHEFQSTVAFLLAYFAGGLTGVQQGLCTPPDPPNPANFYNRYFATLAMPAQQCQSPPPSCRQKNSTCTQNDDCCSGVCTAKTCHDAPTLTCGCQSDNDCALGDSCEAGKCKNACRAASDCPSLRCYDDLFLCASPKNGQDCRQFPGICSPWEECDGTSGGCVERKQPEAVAD